MVGTGSGALFAQEIDTSIKTSGEPLYLSDSILIDQSVLATSKKSLESKSVLAIKVLESLGAILVSFEEDFVLFAEAPLAGGPGNSSIKRGNFLETNTAESTQQALK